MNVEYCNSINKHESACKLLSFTPCITIHCYYSAVNQLAPMRLPDPQLLVPIDCQTEEYYFVGLAQLDFLMSWFSPVSSCMVMVIGINAYSLSKKATRKHPKWRNHTSDRESNGRF